MAIPDSLLARDYFSTAQAQALAVPHDALARAVRDGTLTKLRRGWYSGKQLRWPVERHVLLAKVELAARPGVRLSHYSDLAVRGLPLHRPDLDVVHLRRLEEGRRQRRAHVVVHDRLPHESAAAPCARAVLETALIDPVSALIAGDHALRAEITNPTALDRWMARLRTEMGARQMALVRG